MAKIYYNKYIKRVNSGEITLKQAIALAKKEVPERWRDQVVELLQGGES